MSVEFLFEQLNPELAGFCPKRLQRITPWLRQYVDEGKLPFANVVLLRRGRVAYSNFYGFRDIEERTPVIEDGIYRIYSMSKLITTVAALSLYECGAFQLDDPIHHFLPEFNDIEVLVSGKEDPIASVKPETPITVRQLMNHTSGFTYGAFDPSPVGKIMRSKKIDFGNTQENLGETVRRLASF